MTQGSPRERYLRHVPPSLAFHMEVYFIFGHLKNTFGDKDLEKEKIFHSWRQSDLQMTGSCAMFYP